MSATELDVTRFFIEAAPMDYSASKAEIGEDAGPVNTAPRFSWLACRKGRLCNEH